MRSLLIKLRDQLFETDESAAKLNFLDGDGTKLIFDHVRNFTIAFVVAQAGLIAFSIDAVPSAKVVARTFGAGFLLGAFSLFILNFFHGERLLESSLKRSCLKRIILVFYWTFYLFSALVACSFNVIRAL